eukprot:scaffold1268_cov102-Isochrysis_galbana.AAC.2
MELLRPPGPPGRKPQQLQLRGARHLPGAAPLGPRSGKPSSANDSCRAILGWEGRPRCAKQLPQPKRPPRRHARALPARLQSAELRALGPAFGEFPTPTLPGTDRQPQRAAAEARAPQHPCAVMGTGWACQRRREPPALGPRRHSSHPAAERGSWSVRSTLCLKTSRNNTPHRCRCAARVGVAKAGVAMEGVAMAAVASVGAAMAAVARLGLGLGSMHINSSALRLGFSDSNSCIHI